MSISFNWHDSFSHQGLPPRLPNLQHCSQTLRSHGSTPAQTDPEGDQSYVLSPPHSSRSFCLMSLDVRQCEQRGNTLTSSIFTLHTSAWSLTAAVHHLPASADSCTLALSVSALTGGTKCSRVQYRAHNLQRRIFAWTGSVTSDRPCTQTLGESFSRTCHSAPTRCSSFAVLALQGSVHRHQPCGVVVLVLCRPFPAAMKMLDLFFPACVFFLSSCVNQSFHSSPQQFVCIIHHPCLQNSAN